MNHTLASEDIAGSPEFRHLDSIAGIDVDHDLGRIGREGGGPDRKPRSDEGEHHGPRRDVIASRRSRARNRPRRDVWLGRKLT